MGTNCDAFIKSCVAGWSFLPVRCVTPVDPHRPQKEVPLCLRSSCWRSYRRPPCWSSYLCPDCWRSCLRASCWRLLLRLWQRAGGWGGLYQFCVFRGSFLNFILYFIVIYYIQYVKFLVCLQRLVFSSVCLITPYFTYRLLSKMLQ